MMGAERKSMVQTAQCRRNTAYHEAGHALVALNTRGAFRGFPDFRQLEAGTTTDIGICWRVRGSGHACPCVSFRCQVPHSRTGI
jgi:hypothetical protein